MKKKKRLAKNMTIFIERIKRSKNQSRMIRALIIMLRKRLIDFKSIRTLNLRRSTNSVIVGSGFGQKLQPEPRVDVRPGWTLGKFQPDPRKKTLGFCQDRPKLAVYS